MNENIDYMEFILSRVISRMSMPFKNIQNTNNYFLSAFFL